jgi:hypothetical protein
LPDARPRIAGFAEEHHGLRPVGVRPRGAQRVGGVLVVPARRALRRLEADRRGERVEGQIRSGDVERILRRREHSHHLRELVRAERGHQADDALEIIGARRASVSELLDHLRGGRRGAQAGDDVIAAISRHLSREKPGGLRE